MGDPGLVLPAGSQVSTRPRTEREAGEGKDRKVDGRGNGKNNGEGEREEEGGRGG